VGALCGYNAHVILTTFQKIRVLFYVFLAISLLFVYPLINQLINKHVQKQDIISSSEETKPVDPYYELLSLNSKAFFKDDEKKAWSLIDTQNIEHANSSFVTVGEKSLLVLRTSDGLDLALGPNSMLGIIKEGDLIKIKMSYGCFALRKKGSGHESIKLIGEKYSEDIVSDQESEELNKNFCYYKDSDHIEENKIDLFELPYGLSSNFPQLEIIKPCNDIIEVDDEGSRYAGVDFVFLSPPFTDKSILVSTNEAFTDTVLSTKTSGTEKTNGIEKIRFNFPRGKYFWRVKGVGEDNFSKVCEFEVVHHEEILQKYPENGSVFPSGSSLDFLWSDNLSGVSYSVLINGEKLDGEVVPLNKVFKSSVKNLKLSNLNNDIGTGTFYWKVGSEDGKKSPLRKFSVISKDDINIRSPKKDQIIDPDKKVFIVSCQPYNAVKEYEIRLFNDKKEQIYFNTTSVPFDLLEIPELGDYFLVLDLVFDKGERLSSEPLRFFIDRSKKIEIIYPSKYTVSSVASTGLKKLLWETVDDALFYRVFVNDDKPFDIDSNESLINVKQGLNKVAVYAFCRNTGSIKPCALTSGHSFTIRSFIEDPNSPIIKYPFNRTIFKGGNVSIELSRLKDVAGYKVDISNSINFEDIKEFESVSPKFNFNLKQGTYYWRAYSFIEIDGDRIYSRPTETRIIIAR
jgi:hypothetical protein